MVRESLTEKMKEKAEGVQAVVTMMSSVEDCCRYAAETTRNQGGKTLTAPGLDGAVLGALKAACEATDLQLVVPPLRDDMTGLHTALTYADWGIAETGTLVLKSSSEDLRIATMLSETHIAMLPAANIRAEATELEDEMIAFQAAGPGYLAFITGASRTADIERVLTIGVHGPGELHILIMEDE